MVVGRRKKHSYVELRGSFIATDFCILCVSACDTVIIHCRKGGVDNVLHKIGAGVEYIYIKN